MRTIVIRLLAVLAVFISACTGDKATAPDVVGSISISNATTSLQYGQTVQLTANVIGSNGSPLTGRPVTWSSSNDAIATVNSNGMVAAGAVRGGSAESVQITATSEGRSGSTALTIQPIPVSAAVITSAKLSLYVGQSAALSVVLTDVTGGTLTGRTVTWSTAAPSTATVSSTGVVTAVATGTAVISATVEGKTASVIVTAQPLTLSVTINGPGALVLQNVSTGKSDTLRASGAVAIASGDSLRVIPQETTSSLFDGIGGIVTDSVQLLPSYAFRVRENAALTLRFVPRLRSAKVLQNAFFDTTALRYRTSENFVVWWDKRWDHNYLAKDLLLQMEQIRTKTTGWGVPQPPGAGRILINIYIHHITREGKNVDVFDDGWGQGVGTDRFGMPYYTAPAGESRVTINYPPNTTHCWCYGATWHEGFHINMWGAGKLPNPAFPYSGDSAWFTEATADWFERLFTLSAANSYLGGYTTFNGTPAFLMQPQRRLWGPPMQPTWSQGVHAYAAHLFLLYLSWNGYMQDNFIAESVLSQTTLTPQEYFFRNIPNFKTVYRRFAREITTLDGIPAWAANQIAQTVDFWRTHGAKYGNALPDGRNDDNTYAFDLRDAGTNGWVKPAALLEAWAYSVTKITATSNATYRVSLRTATSGSRGTPSDLQISLVTMINGVRTYANIELSASEGSGDIVLPAGAAAYVVVISTPMTFSGAETFDYSINVQRNP